MTRHKIITTIPEVHVGIIPKDKANEIADLYKEGKSNNDMLGLVRIDGKKIQPSTIETVCYHISEIEDSMRTLLNGTSIIYQPVYTEQLNEETGEIDRTQVNMIPDIPNTYQELKDLLMILVSYNINIYQNIYDTEITSLTEQIYHVMDNVLEVNGNNFEQYKIAING